MIGLGGAEFRLPVLIGLVGFAALAAVILLFEVSGVDRSVCREVGSQARESHLRMFTHAPGFITPLTETAPHTRPSRMFAL